MLTRREKLLIRPWQLRRYNNHRKKVLTALPVIDFGPPPQMGHVTLKLKKLQKEGERRTKIEEDNFRLLQRMGAIMKKNRLDNFWLEKPPNFLRRVGIYHRTRSPSPCEVTPVSSPRIENTRKSRCLACSPQLQKSTHVPEERIPWEAPKKSVSNKGNASSTTLIISNRDAFPSNFKNFSKTHKSVQKNSYLPFIDRKTCGKAMEETSKKKIVLEQGPLRLSVNFPIHVDVKVKSVNGEKYVAKSSLQAFDKI